MIDSDLCRSCSSPDWGLLFSLTVLVSNQVYMYKWVPVNFMLGGNLAGRVEIFYCIKVRILYRVVSNS